MQRTLITFLGTGRYDETLYRWQGIGEHRTPHVAAALSTLWNAARIVVLATEAAQAVNGERLRKSLAAANQPQPVFKRLSDGRSESELWLQFPVIREAVEEAASEEMLFDVTHGFRAQPFFAGAVLSVLRASGLKPNNLALVYGEYRSQEPVSPIWDLTLFIELVDWAQALALFLKTGVADPVVELSREVQRREAKKAIAAGSRNIPSFGRLVGAIERFADDLATLRVASIITGYEQMDSRKANARGSGAILLDAIRQCREEVLAKVPPLALILEQLAESVVALSAARLHSPEGQRAQFALARHYLKLTRYPEAAVVVREARVNTHAPGESAVEVNSPDFDDEQRRLADAQFAAQDPHSREIADIRNDIEHAGFRQQPLSAKALQTRIDRLVHRFATADHVDSNGSSQEPLPSPRGSTLFVTRHAGAREWAARQGIAVDRIVEHLDPAEIQAGDLVIGTLPVHLAAEVCSRGARYWHLVLELPAERRGLELTAQDMQRFSARVAEYRVERIP
ncbi:MAG: CRISPR-associated protein Csx16 [Acidobacteriota bacterium]